MLFYKYYAPACILTARRYNWVSVTRQSIRAGSWYFSHKVVTVQGEYGAVFAIQVQNFMSITRVAIQVWSGAGKCSRYTELYCGHWRSVAVQTISKPEICQGVGFWLRADARVRVYLPLRICHGCRSKCKNCDELINYTVRVISRYCFSVHHW
jgi:hypothetical protein